MYERHSVDSMPVNLKQLQRVADEGHLTIAGQSDARPVVAAIAAQIRGEVPPNALFASLPVATALAERAAELGKKGEAVMRPHLAGVTRYEDAVAGLDADLRRALEERWKPSAAAAVSGSTTMAKVIEAQKASASTFRITDHAALREPLRIPPLKVDRTPREQLAKLHELVDAQRESILQQNEQLAEERSARGVDREERRAERRSDHQHFIVMAALAAAGIVTAILIALLG
jgi:hypothetical protein